MATLRNWRKLAAINREYHEDNLGNNQALKTNSIRFHEDYLTQVSQEIENKMTRKLSQEFNRKGSRSLGALSRVDDFLLNSQARLHSGSVSETFWNSRRENQGTNEDCSQNDLHPEVGVSLSQFLQELSSEETSYRWPGEFFVGNFAGEQLFRWIENRNPLIWIKIVYKWLFVIFATLAAEALKYKQLVKFLRKFYWGPFWNILLGRICCAEIFYDTGAYLDKKKESVR